MKPSDPDHEVLSGVRKHVAKRQRWLSEGDPSLPQQFARVGVLGWLVVMPMLLGTLLGRWIDRSFGTGIFWTAPLLFIGLGLGCWSAWKWIHRS